MLSLSCIYRSFRLHYSWLVTINLQFTYVVTLSNYFVDPSIAIRYVHIVSLYKLLILPFVEFVHHIKLTYFANLHIIPIVFWLYIIMGNDHSNTLKVGDIFPSRRAIIDKANHYSHTLCKSNRICKNRDLFLHIICTLQYQEDCKVDTENTCRIKNHLANGGTRKKFIKIPYPSICNRCIKAYPHKEPGVDGN